MEEKCKIFNVIMRNISRSFKLVSLKTFLLCVVAPDFCKQRVDRSPCLFSRQEPEIPLHSAPLRSTSLTLHSTPFYFTPTSTSSLITRGFNTIVPLTHIPFLGPSGITCQVPQPHSSLHIAAHVLFCGGTFLHLVPSHSTPSPESSLPARHVLV